MEMPNYLAMILENQERLERKLDLHMAGSAHQLTPVPDEFLTVAKTAEFLNCSKPHVYVLQKRIPSVHRGGKLYFKRSDLIAYLEGGRSVPDKRMGINRK